MKQIIDNIVYESKPSFGCDGCVAQFYSGLCTTLHSGCDNCSGVIWIKKEVAEPVPDVSSDKITFSEAQVKYLQEVFGINVNEVLPVKDGFVKKTDMVYWAAQYGPEHVLANEHWHNIKGYPDLYSVKEPEYKVVYE